MKQDKCKSESLLLSCRSSEEELIKSLTVLIVLSHGSNCSFVISISVKLSENYVHY